MAKLVNKPFNFIKDTIKIPTPTNRIVGLYTMIRRTWTK